MGQDSSGYNITRVWSNEDQHEAASMGGMKFSCAYMHSFLVNKLSEIHSIRGRSPAVGRSSPEQEPTRGTRTVRTESKSRRQGKVPPLPELEQSPNDPKASSPPASPPALPPPNRKRRAPSPPPSPPPISKRHSPESESGPSEQRSGSSSSTKSKPSSMPPHPYDTCATSYKQIPKKRGVRYTITVNGKEEIKRTPMERLIKRKAKYNYVREHGHPFGDKHGCYFNPYSYSRVNETVCKRIDKPPGFQVGRGGPGKKPIHELIGLRDDYDFRLDIAGSIRKALVKFKPKNVQLESGQNLTYSKHYGSSSRSGINNFMLERFPFLFHFRDDSGEDNWAFCISSLASNSSYVKAGNDKADVYLKRNESGPRGPGGGDGNGNGHGDDDSDNDNQEPSTGYEDDYTLNARAARNQNTSTSNKRSRPSEPNSNSRRSHNDDLRPQKKPREEPEARSPSPVPLPTEPTAADVRRAKKVVARKEARDKALGASRDKVGAKTVAAPKGKGKGKERAIAPAPSKSTRKRNRLEDEDNSEDSDDESVHLISKKRTSPPLSDTESTPKTTTGRKPAKANSKKAGKSDTTKAAKGTNRKRPASWPYMRPRSPATNRQKINVQLKDADEEPEEDFEQFAEPEEPESRPIQKRPTPKQPPPQEEDEEDEELTPLPPSLAAQFAAKLAQGEREQNDQEGGDRARSASHRVPVDKAEAGPSKALKSQANQAVEQINTQELVKLGRAKPVGTIKIKPPVPASDRTLRKR